MPKTKAPAKAPSSDDSDSGPDDRTPAKKAKKTNDGESVFDLSKDRRVTVRSFKGKVLVDIREFYTPKDGGDPKPGKKGIALSPDQWKSLMELSGQINDAIKEM